MTEPQSVPGGTHAPQFDALSADAGARDGRHRRQRRRPRRRGRRLHPARPARADRHRLSLELRQARRRRPARRPDRRLGAEDRRDAAGHPRALTAGARADRRLPRGRADRRQQLLPARPAVRRRPGLLRRAAAPHEHDDRRAGRRQRRRVRRHVRRERRPRRLHAAADALVRGPRADDAGLPDPPQRARARRAWRARSCACSASRGRRPSLGALKRLPAHGPRRARRALHLHAEPCGERDVRAAARARAAGATRRRARSCTVDAAAGENTLKLTTKQLGRRAGLYRLTATLADGGAQHAVQFRIKRRRSARRAQDDPRAVARAGP